MASSKKTAATNASVEVTVTPATLYISQDPTQTSYGQLVFTFTNPGSAVSLNGIGINLPSALYQPGSLSSINPGGDSGGLWNFNAEGNPGAFQAQPSSGNPVMLGSSQPFTLSLSNITLGEPTPGTTLQIGVAVIPQGGEPLSFSLPVTIQTAVQSIEYFKGAPADIRSGDNATLTWNCPGMDYCILNPSGGGHLPASGSINVTPDSTTAYTLNAYASGVNLSAQFTITVENVQIVTFGVPQTQNPAVYGQTLDLSWTCNQFTKQVSLICSDPAIILPSTLKINDKVKIGPITQTTNIQLTASGEDPSNVTNQPLSIAVVPPACTFTPSSETVWHLDPVTISWDLESVSAVSINPPLPGNLNPSMQNLKGSVNINPSDSITYTLSYSGYVNGAIQSFTKQAVITVQHLAINSFTATPGVILPGQAPNQLTLAWDVQAPLVTIDNGIGTVSASGNKVITSPPDGSLYQITAGTTTNPAILNRSVLITNLFTPLAIASLFSASIDSLPVSGIVLQRSPADFSWMPHTTLPNNSASVTGFGIQGVLSGISTTDGQTNPLNVAGFLTTVNSLNQLASSIPAVTPDALVLIFIMYTAPVLVMPPYQDEPGLLTITNISPPTSGETTNLLARLSPDGV